MTTPLIIIAVIVIAVYVAYRIIKHKINKDLDTDWFKDFEV